MGMDPNAGPAMPPEMMQALMDQGGDTGQDPTAEDSGGGSPEDNPIEILRQMIEMAQQYMQIEPDESDKGTMAKVLAQLQGYLAKDQADRDKLLGNPAAARVLRKS